MDYSNTNLKQVDIFDFNTNTNNSTQSTANKYQDVIRLLEAIHGDNDVCFQTFDDSKKGNRSIVGNWHGSINRATMNRIGALNSKGAGVYYTVNQTDGKGRTAANIVGINALFTDFDKVEPQNLDKLPPASAVVQSKNGKHIYWFLNPGQDIKLFTSYQTMLSELTGGDPVVKDLPRVLRLPSFNHMKNPESPFMVKLVELHTDRRYNLSDFPTPTPDTIKKSKALKLTAGASYNISGSIESLESLVAEYRSMIAPAPLSAGQVANKRAQMTRKLSTSSRLLGNASDTMLKLGNIMGSLLTTATMKPVELVELMFEASKAQFCSEVKQDGSVWNEEEARGHHIPRGLAYFLNSAIESQKAAKKNSEFPSGIIKNSQYVSDMGIDYKKELVTIINSAIGTGKTRALVETIRDILAVNPDAQIRVACHRVQLVRQWEHDLAELGFIAYDNKEAMAGYKNVSDVKRYITTYDSLDRFLHGLWVVNKKTPRVLILDEVDQAFNYFLTATETTIARVRTETFDVLKMLMKVSTSIIATSATVTNTEAKVLKYLTGSDSLQVFINEHKPYQKRFVKLPDINAAYSRICKSIDEGKNVYAPLDSASDAEALHDRLKARYPQLSMALFTAANKSQYDQSDINTLVQKYQVVVTSPTLGTGTDINCQYFHDVVGIFTNSRDLGAADCLQATGRVRYPLGNVYAFIDDKAPTKEYVDSVRDKIFCLSNNTLNTDWISYPHITGESCEGDDEIRIETKKHPDMEAATKFQAEYLEKQLASKFYRGSQFWQTVSEAGHIITDEAKGALGKTITKSDLRAANEEIKQNNAQSVIDAPVLTEDEASQLKALKDSALSRTDKAALERFFIAKGMKKQDLTVEDILWYGKVGKNALRVHKLATMDKKLSWSLDYQDYGKLSDYDAKFAQKDKKTMDALVTAIAPALERGQFTKSDLGGFEVVMKSLGAEAIRRLGIKVDMTKATVVANGILGLMGYEVEKKRVRVDNVLVSLVSFKESSKDTRTKELDYLYTVTPGEYKYLFKYSLVPQITFEAIEDAEYLDSLNDA
ncbi:DEAD/DEAH box helicase family protein [Nostoc sp. FACHB-888]|uniref:DEAD/DEAH box helicase family protein n=1 Tax=Nostoc sp. FACHB-888 TaxID=2692842 RepID=UPI001681CE45|nr:DEAD/DEAH box helicase family protein [Nostoc sp. FACHB-888]MBD2245125.1 DEAD/DEAH box helicase family protein [Nostoc sp. FACHB-888]